MYLFLVNPEAGNKAFKRIESKMLDMLKTMGLKHTFVMIEDLDKTDELIEKYVKGNEEAVVAVGGNATINAVINGISSEDVPVGIIPLSKTNHLARSLGIRSWMEGVKILAKPETKAVRLGKAGKHYFVGKLDIVSQLNLITKYLPRTNFLYKFLGLQHNITVNDVGVKSAIQLDEDLVVSARVQKLNIELNENRDEKKMKIEIFARGGQGSAVSKFEADSMQMESARKLHVLSGNETIGYTPIEIKALSKYIKLIVPPTPKLAETK